MTNETANPGNNSLLSIFAAGSLNRGIPLEDAVNELMHEMNIPESAQESILATWNALKFWTITINGELVGVEAEPAAFEFYIEDFGDDFPAAKTFSDNAAEAFSKSYEAGEVDGFTYTETNDGATNTVKVENVPFSSITPMLPRDWV